MEPVIILEPCSNCKSINDLKKCRKTPCQYHDTFIVKALEFTIRKIMKMKKRTIFINSKDHFDRENPENNYHGWSDPKHMQSCIQSLLKFYHYSIQLAAIDDHMYDSKHPIDIKCENTVCTNCESNVGIKKCLDTECQIHNTFIFKQLSTKLRRIQYSTEGMRWLEDMSEPYTVQHHCATYDSVALYIFEYIEIDNPNVMETEKDYLDACYHSWCDSREDNKHGVTIFGEGEHCEKCGLRRHGNFLDVEWNDELPDYGDLFTLEDFVDACECGAFIDYDGSGYYSDGKREARNKSARPSYITKNRIDKRFSHVMWYNR